MRSFESICATIPEESSGLMVGMFVCGYTTLCCEGVGGKV